ncbi:MAG TPA: glycosyltransferase [Phycisphaerae bacterium]|nr:glycosyltransferase [Phycisphaerae bacterium]HRY71192.1 glycosyltransferase [Phycisphaerae bacterium]HSA29496.1 glycosyltransferase [Phycisphaerae bacterium]
MGSATTLSLVVFSLWLVGFIVLGRLLGRRAAAVAPGRTPDPTIGDALSVIIPARNEERNLPTLLRSLASQSVRPREIVLVDDGSTDRTAEVACQLGARVVSSEPLPDGWRGKTWACWQGARVGSGELLLFVDADTWFETDGLQYILNSRVDGVLSVGPYHVLRRPYEQLSAFFNLLMTAGTGAFRLLGGEPNGLFGQMLLVGRDDYRRVQGHEAVKGRILENFYLAERFREHGVGQRCVFGKGAAAFRMYPDGLGQLIEGWTKSFASGAAQTSRVLLLLIVMWMAGMVLCPYLLTRGWTGLSMYSLYAAQLYLLLRQIGDFRWYTAVFYPVPLIFYFAVFTLSMLRSRRQVTWKGRTIRAY